MRKGRIQMFNKKSKLMVAGVLVACGLAAIAWKSAWATPGVGITTTIIAGPTSLGDNHVHSNSDVNAVEIKTKGDSDCYVVLNRIAPGGHTGWHSHPGPSIVSVVSGTATEYRDDDPNATVYPAGNAFVDEGGDHAHLVANEGTTELVLVAFQIIPDGATRRIDKPAP